MRQQILVFLRPVEVKLIHPAELYLCRGGVEYAVTIDVFSDTACISFATVTPLLVDGI